MSRASPSIPRVLNHVMHSAPDAWTTRLLQSQPAHGQQQHVSGSKLEKAVPVLLYLAIHVEAHAFRSMRTKIQHIRSLCSGGGWTAAARLWQ